MGIENEIKIEPEYQKVVKVEIIGACSDDNKYFPEKYFEIYKSYKTKDYKSCLSFLSDVSEELDEYHILKSACLIHLGTDISEAHEILDQIILKDPDNSYTHYTKGLAFYHEERYKESIECFEKARYLDPTEDMERAEVMIEKALYELKCSESPETPVSSIRHSPESSYVSRRFGCEICNHFFGKKFNLDRHNRSIHKRSTPSNFPTKQKHSYVSSTTSPVKANMHPSKASPIKRKVKLYSKLKAARKGKVKCPTCHHFFKKSSIARHVIIHSGNKPHKCTECPMAFFQKSDLCRHLATHSDEMNFECDLCDRKFRIKKNLQVHKRRHHPQGL